MNDQTDKLVRVDLIGTASKRIQVSDSKKSQPYLSTCDYQFKKLSSILEEWRKGKLGT